MWGKEPSKFYLLNSHRLNKCYNSRMNSNVIVEQIKGGLKNFDGLILPEDFVEEELKKLKIKPEEESSFFYVVCRGDAKACAALLVASFHKFLFVHHADLWTLGKQNLPLPQLDEMVEKTTQYNEWRSGRKTEKPEWFNERDDWHKDNGNDGPKMR